MTGCDTTTTNRFFHPYCIFRSVQDVQLEAAAVVGPGQDRPRVLRLCGGVRRQCQLDKTMKANNQVVKLKEEMLPSRRV